VGIEQEREIPLWDLLLSIAVEDLLVGCVLNEKPAVLIARGEDFTGVGIGV